MVAQLTHVLPGFRLVDGSVINTMMDDINNLNGNGTAGPVTATTLSSTTSQTFGGTLSITPQILAAAGSTQGGATAITSQKAVVTAATTVSTKGVRLPAAATGLEVEVANAATFGFKVYPATGGKIGAASTNAADTTLAINKANRYIAVNTTFWVVQRGA